MKKDDSLKMQIEELLSNNMRNSSLGINIEIENGFVKLHGIVDTLAEKDYATKIINKITEIKGIDNSLTIAMDYYRNDDKITHMVEQRFINEPKVKLEKIGAECEKGIVILRGQASSLGEIEIARELAEEIPGVKEVRSLVKISKDAKEIDDASIVNAVELAFVTSEIIEAEDVDTNCFKGTVTLKGTVDTFEQKEAAEVIAKSIPGVRNIINSISTRHGTINSDLYLTNQLRSEMNSHTGVSAGQVKAYVVKGTAFLSGRVYSYESKYIAEEVAEKIEGIEQVVNDIIVFYH